MGSLENWQKLKKNEFYQSQLFLVSVEPGRERKIKFHMVLSFRNSDWQKKNICKNQFPRL